jgi:hypothetical protein
MARVSAPGAAFHTGSESSALCVPAGRGPRRAPRAPPGVVPREPARPALARGRGRGTRSVPRLAVGGDAAADAGGNGGAYYERWLERFPTLAALADAPLDDVLKAWEGLGYYSRARNFHGAVREVRARHGGRGARRSRGVRRAPGVGRYTAGAVMSIAFGRPRRSWTATCAACSPAGPTTRSVRDADLWAMASRLAPAPRRAS